LTPRDRRTVTLASMLFGTAMWLVGCGQGAAPAGDASAGTVIPPGEVSDGLVVTLGTEPNPPKKGENAIRVTVTRSDGSPVSAGTVTAVFSMPAMPSMNMPEMRSDAALQHEGGGRYQGTGQLSMSGTWNLTIRVAEGDKEVATRHTSIVAKE
jgi:Cu(I)/Ag(I) efflux system membrane fusion protein